MFRQIRLPHRSFYNPQEVLNRVQPQIFAMRVILETEDNGQWTHTQRSKFNFVLGELLTNIENTLSADTKPSPKDDVGDIPF